MGWRGDPRPSGTAPLGMTKTPTLRVSTDLLDPRSRAPPPRALSGGSGKRGAIAPAPGSHSGQASDWLWRGVPDQSLVKPRIGRGSGPDLSPVPKNQRHVRRPWWPCAFHIGKARAPSGGCERSKSRRALPPCSPMDGQKRGETAPAPRPHFWASLGLGEGQDPTWRRGLPHGRTRAQAHHSSALP